MRSQKIDAGGDEKQEILFTWPKGTFAIQSAELASAFNRDGCMDVQQQIHVGDAGDPIAYLAGHHVMFGHG